MDVEDKCVEECGFIDEDDSRISDCIKDDNLNVVGSTWGYRYNAFNFKEGEETPYFSQEGVSGLVKYERVTLGSTPMWFFKDARFR